MERLSHILFDFFGTLVSYSESRIEQGFSRSYNLIVANGSDMTYSVFLNQWDRMFRQFEALSAVSQVEFSMTDLCQCFLQGILGKSPDSELIASFRDTYLKEWSKGVTYIPGVNEMLANLSAKYRLVLVTNTHHAGLVQKHLQDSGMERHFIYVITSVEHGKRKPDRSIFEHALQVSNCPKEAALFVGDSYSMDYEGARAAGLPSLLIDPNQEHRIPNSHRLNRILDLPSAILQANQSF
jgi:putative hydrolase of the HAD superfamily